MKINLSKSKTDTAGTVHTPAQPPEDRGTAKLERNLEPSANPTGPLPVPVPVPVPYDAEPLQTIINKLKNQNKSNVFNLVSVEDWAKLIPVAQQSAPHFTELFRLLSRPV